MLYRIYKLDPKAIVNYLIRCKRSYSSKILEIGMILGEKIARKVYVNEQNFVSDIQLLIKFISFVLSFLHELLMILQIYFCIAVFLFYLCV